MHVTDLSPNHCRPFRGSPKDGLEALIAFPFQDDKKSSQVKNQDVEESVLRPSINTIVEIFWYFRASDPKNRKWPKPIPRTHSLVSNLFIPLTNILFSNANRSRALLTRPQTCAGKSVYTKLAVDEKLNF